MNRLSLLVPLLLLLYLFLPPMAVAEDSATSYARLVQEAVNKNWLGHDFSHNVAVELVFAVDHEGRVTNMRIKKSSGNNVDDQTAIDAVKNANIPPVPASMPDKTIDVELHLEHLARKK